jgi:PPK2 family polyphosphate:nucleotide phosphotransferase
MKQAATLVERFRVASGKHFRLKDHDPADTGGLQLSKDAAAQRVAAGVAQLSDLQTRLYAEDKWSLLCVFQAMDAAGKDGTIRHVMTGVNPQGVQVSAFKQPGPEELDHDFLWRVSRELPQRGRIGIFNRSHYEDVLVARIHPEILARQKLPPRLIGKNFWKQRLQDIAAYERYLHHQGTVVLKFFLNISPEEQRTRFLARLENPEKYWKFSLNDIKERARWDDYMSAYEEAIIETAAPHAPWFVVPANHKWFAHLIVVEAMIEALQSLDLRFPEISADTKGGLAAAKEMLERE